MPRLLKHHVYISKERYILIVQDLHGVWTLPTIDIPKNSKHSHAQTVFQNQFSMTLKAERFLTKIDIEKDQTVTHFAICDYRAGLFKCSKAVYQQALWIKPEHIKQMAARGKMTLSLTLKSMLPQRHYANSYAPPGYVG